MRFSPFPVSGPEVSDCIVAFDGATLARLPVAKVKVAQEFRAVGNERAARIVEAMPEREGGFLDERAADELLVAAHCEMQRISEEFQHGQRVAELLRPIIRCLREDGLRGTVRVVDIGCGTGYVMRWLAARDALGPEVELIGADFNAALVNEANRLAQAENLSCSFVHANAFRLAQPAHIYLSTGILHHFRRENLTRLFAQHEGPATQAFVHFDFHASPLSPFGAWLFHIARMRTALARHDGVLSAVRAHSGRRLLAAAREGAPGFVSALYGVRLWGLPIPRAFHALVGLRPQFQWSFARELGRRAFSLGVQK